MTSEAEEMRWCALGCGLEMPADATADGALCPKCGAKTQPYGWRYRNSRGTFEYASAYETLPLEVRRKTK